MNKIFLYDNIMKSNEYVSKLIKFCCSICNKVTFSTRVSSYRLLSDELPRALEDIGDEYIKEDDNRRKEYLTDNAVKEELLHVHGTNEEVIAYFDRLRQYDLVELENVKELLLQYQRESQDYGMPIKYSDCIDKSFPQESYLEERFSAYSHCTIGGGLYKVYSFKVDKEIENMLLEECKLFSYYTFNDIYTLDDPAFYDDDKLICSICSHEQHIVLFLNDDQCKAFHELGIPYE